MLAIVVVALTATAVVVLSRATERQHARDQRAAAAQHTAFLRSVDREQRPSSGRGARDPGATASAADRIAARTALLAGARTRVRADAVARTHKHILSVSCEPFPRTLGGVAPVEDLGRRAAAYACTAVTDRLGASGIMGFPFRVIARFAAGTFAWCRVVPLDGEDRLTHGLPRPCRLP
jgi:hypothetical protein